MPAQSTASSGNSGMGTGSMDCPGDQFLAGPRFAFDQHRDRGGGRGFHQPEDLGHRRPGSDDLVKILCRARSRRRTRPACEFQASDTRTCSNSRAFSDRHGDASR